jgi:glycosyltransferase involved in cell wall biosynthesis
VLPTKNRAAFIPHAIQCFKAQTYPRKELIIVDNGEDATASLISDMDFSIRYFKVEGPKTTGEMRNLCAVHARGEFIAHFDSDDWSAPERVIDQVTRLGDHGVVTGYHSMLFYDIRDGKTYHWQMPHSPVRYVLGTSLCYRREWWRHHQFNHVQVGEDIRFFMDACRLARRLVTSAPAEKLMVARVHNHQTSHKSLNRTSYAPMSPLSLPVTFPCGSI